MRPAAPSMSPEELGKLLRQARRRVGWDLDRLHGATGIPRPYIQALEEGHLEALPAIAHVRGYVRSYAEALRLDGDDLTLALSRWLEDNPLPSSRRTDRSRLPTPRRSDRQRQARAWPAPSGWSEPWSVSRIIKTLAGGAAVVVLVALLAAALWSGGGNGKGTKVAGSRVTASSTPRKAEGRSPARTARPTTTAAPTALEPASTQTGGATYSVGRPQFSLVVETSGSCWVQVRSGQSGPVVFQGTLPAGDSKTFPAEGPLWLRVGNAAALAVRVDGATVTMPHDPGMVYNLLFQV
jgi:cytoskeleton protein RodZ